MNRLHDTTNHIQVLAKQVVFGEYIRHAAEQPFEMDNSVPVCEHVCMVGWTSTPRGSRVSWLRREFNSSTSAKTRSGKKRSQPVAISKP